MSTEKTDGANNGACFARATHVWLAVNHNTSGPLRIEL